MTERKRITPIAWLRRAERFLIEPLTDNILARPVLRRLSVFGQFIYMVLRGFVDNRCPLRAAALSYTTLLALIPLLAVVLSVSKNFLHETSADFVPKVLDRMVVIVSPQLEFMPLPEDVLGPPSPNRAVVSDEARRHAVETIQSFIDRISAGTLGTIGTIFLIFIAIRLLTTIEQTFNDIWGVQKGRSIWRKVVYYWTTITLGPLLLLGALAMTGRAEFVGLFGKLQLPLWIEGSVLKLIPFVLLWFGFSLMYGLMPNTRVGLRAAVIGGIVGGTLWQLNSLLSTMYLSRVVTYSKIYGTLGIIPVFLVGLYFSWLVVLLGAQVSFAVQNLRIYMQRRASERIDQQGRELIACRAVLMAAQRFARGEKPPSTAEIAEKLGAPLHLLNQVVYRLSEGGVLSESANEQGGLLPARPLESIRVTDVLHLLRTGNEGGEKQSDTSDGEIIARLLGDLHTAEREAASNLSYNELASRSEHR